MIYDSATVYDISMQPTLNANSGIVDTDMVYYNKLSDVKRGNIVVIAVDDTMIIKRVVAVAGDRIRYTYEDGVYRVYHNNMILLEEYVKEEITTEKLINSGNAVLYKDYDDVTGYNPFGVLKANQPDRFDELGNYVVAEDEIFAMGDNRLHSTDSKTHGGYKVDNVVGVVEMVISSKDDAVAKLFNFVF